jgi:hypothetical protein
VQSARAADCTVPQADKPKVLAKANPAIIIFVVIV